MRTKQVRPETLEYEYLLDVSIGFDKVTEKNYVLFNFRTAKVFENFQYRLNVDTIENLEKKEMKFNIEGLSAPVISLSKSGNAKYLYRLFDYKQTEYTVVITKRKKEKNIFKIKISKSKIKMTSEPRKKFINVTVS